MWPRTVVVLAAHRSDVSDCISCQLISQVSNPNERRSYFIIISHVKCHSVTVCLCVTGYMVARLVVQNTELGCNLEKDLWGPLMFKEIVLTNNRFQALDNHAFQPFSSTLTALDLGKLQCKSME